MKSSQRFLIVVLLILAAIFIILCIYLDAILEALARQWITFMAKNLAREGILLTNWEFNKASISFPPAIALKELSSLLTLSKSNALRIGHDFFLTVKSTSLSVTNILNGEFSFNVENAVVLMRPEFVSTNEKAEDFNMRNKLEIIRLRLPFRINIFKPKEAALQLAPLFSGFARFAKQGVTNMRMDFSGLSEFVVGRKLVKGKLLLAPYSTEKRLVMDRKDFKNISDVLGEKLTEDEFDVYCNNPLRMPRMLEIRNYSSDKAMGAKKMDANVPEEAYKHILWGYFLTLAYDEKFSKEVTDSHEINAIGRSERAVRTYLAAQRGMADASNEEGNKKTEAEIRMDVINNSIGRKYARNGYKEDSLLSRTMSDADVVRSYYDLLN